MVEEYRLSRNFFTTKYGDDEDVMSELELYCRKTAALFLGIVPFGSTYFWLKFFCFCPTMQSASLMLASAQIFASSQHLIWGKYVPYPSGDSINSRLAQYGISNQPEIDLDTINKALYSPGKLKEGEWNLDQWQKITI